jgi:hypothetical protein
VTDGPEVPAPRVTGRIVVPGPLAEPHLADTSVWIKVRIQPALADWFNAEVRAGRIVTCGVVVLELLLKDRSLCQTQGGGAVIVGRSSLLFP